MSNRPMRTSGRLVGLVTGACAAVALNAHPAAAEIITPEPATSEPGMYVHVGNKWRLQHATICDIEFNYVQRMTIDGVSAMVPTVVLYPPGRHPLALRGTCEGHYIYGVGTSAG